MPSPRLAPQPRSLPAVPACLNDHMGARCRVRRTRHSPRSAPPTFLLSRAPGWLCPAPVTHLALRDPLHQGPSQLDMCAPSSPFSVPRSRQPGCDQTPCSPHRCSHADPQPGWEPVLKPLPSSKPSDLGTRVKCPNPTFLVYELEDVATCHLGWHFQIFQGPLPPGLC